MAIFWKKPWVDPFGKISISRLFKLLVFKPLESRYFALEYRKTHFPGLYCLMKKDGKMGNFWPKPRVNTFGKISISRLFERFFFCSEESRFFVLEYRKTHFPGLHRLKKKNGKMAIFWPKQWVNPFEKISIFRLFQLVVLIA